MSHDLVIVLSVGGPALALLWWEVRRLRDSRHDHASKLTALGVTVEAVQRDVTEVRGDVRVIRDGLIAKRIIEPEGL